MILHGAPQQLMKMCGRRRVAILPNHLLFRASMFTNTAIEVERPLLSYLLWNMESDGKSSKTSPQRNEQSATLLCARAPCRVAKPCAANHKGLAQCPGYKATPAATGQRLGMTWNDWISAEQIFQVLKTFTSHFVTPGSSLNNSSQVTELSLGLWLRLWNRNRSRFLGREVEL